MLTLPCGGVSFLLGEEKWLYQNAKILSLLAQSAKREIMHQAKIQLQILKELKSQNSVQDAEREPFIKKQNNLDWGKYV